MTANQINYAKQQEEKRHNLVTEDQKLRDLAIGERNAVANELQASVARSKQLEEARHNAAQEVLSRYQTDMNVGEISRHNIVAEQQNALGIQNLQAYQQGQLRIGEHQAQSSRIQAESGRLSSQAAYRQSSAALTQAQASLQQAAASQLQASTRASELTELMRHNLVGEEIQQQQADTAATGAQADLIRAESSLVSAESSRLNAEAALTRATTEAGLAASKGFSNYASGFRDVTSGIGEALRSTSAIGGLAKSILGG